MKASAVLVRLVYYGMIFICWLLVLLCKEACAYALQHSIGFGGREREKSFRVQDFSLLFTV
jgi:hypothetical protein